MRHSFIDAQKVNFVMFCHSVLDTESSVFKYFWIPALTGMTVKGTFSEFIIL